MPRYKQLKKLTSAQEKLLLAHYRAEWLEAEYALEKHEKIEKAKEVGAQIGKNILGLALAARAVTIALVTPGAFMAIGIFRERRKSGRGTPIRHYIVSSRLPQDLRMGSSRQYWQYQKKGADTYEITITKKGREKALAQMMREFKLRKKDRWDGQWRIVMFDIPRKNNWVRNELRKKLKEIGMHQLQQSVFVYPYPCEAEIDLWVDLLSANDAVIQITTTLPKKQEKEAKEYFGL